MKAEYDHVATDHDAPGPECSICHEADEDYEIKQCVAKGCERFICCDCRADFPVFDELDVCSEDCAIAVISDMRRDLYLKTERIREMGKTLREIRDIDPQNLGHNDPKTMMAYALGTAQGKAIYGAAWADPV